MHQPDSDNQGQSRNTHSTGSEARSRASTAAAPLLARPAIAGLAVAVLAVAVLAAAAGCGKWQYLFESEKLKTIPAECDKLRGKRVAVVVWAEPSTLDVDPYACSRTAERIVWHFNQNRSRDELKKTRFVDVRRVNDYQERVGVSGPTKPNAEVARALDAELLLRVDLFEYTTRAPEASSLIKGRISGNLSLHDSGGGDSLYRGEVTAEYPEGSSIGLLDRTDEEVLNETLRAFGETTARKFYTHEVDY